MLHLNNLNHTRLHLDTPKPCQAAFRYPLCHARLHLDNLSNTRQHLDTPKPCQADFLMFLDALNDDRQWIIMSNWWQWKSVMEIWWSFLLGIRKMTKWRKKCDTLKINTRKPQQVSKCVKIYLIFGEPWHKGNHKSIVYLSCFKQRIINSM